jgi:hypothetical protein
MMATAKRGPIPEEAVAPEGICAALEILEVAEAFLGFFIRLNIP